MRYVLSIFLGVGVAMAMIGLMEAIGARIWVQPEVHSTDRAVIAAAINQMPAAAMWWLVAGYSVGGLAGAFVAQKIFGGINTRPAKAVGVALLIGAVLNSMQLPQPQWLNIASAIAPVVAAALGAFLASPKRA